MCFTTQGSLFLTLDHKFIPITSIHWVESPTVLIALCNKCSPFIPITNSIYSYLDTLVVSKEHSLLHLTSAFWVNHSSSITHSGFILSLQFFHQPFSHKNNLSNPKDLTWSQISK